eukprot:scaffold24859_cov71-Phaeocystis_antarctica.AAC.5
MIWMICNSSIGADEGYPCGRLRPSPVRRRRWPDATSRLDPPAFEGAQALALDDRGSTNFDEGADTTLEPAQSTKKTRPWTQTGRRINLENCALSTRVKVRAHKPDHGPRSRVFPVSTRLPIARDTETAASTADL